MTGSPCRAAPVRLPAVAAPLYLVALLCLAALAAPPARAGEWEPFGLPGLTIRSLAAAPGRLCAGTAGRGVFCLDPLSATGWKGIGPDGATVTDLWIDPADPEVILAAVDSTLGLFAPLYRTSDGGAGWERIDALPTAFGAIPRVYAVQGVSGAGTLVAAGSAVWRSDDRGDTWRLLRQDGGLVSLAIAPTDPDTLWVGGETLIFMGFTLQSRDGGTTWRTAWDSRAIGDNQTSDIAPHPARHGMLLTGHEGFVLRSLDDGDSFDEVLQAPSRFFLDWDAGNPDRAWAAGSPNGPDEGHAFVSRDLGRTWSDISGPILGVRTVYRLRADAARLGVVYAATDDGVYRFYGGGLPLCLDTRGGLDALHLWLGVCPPILSPGASVTAPGPVIRGDAIAFDLEAVAEADGHIDLGVVECLVDGADIAFSTIDVPEPAAGKAVAILDRLEGDYDYGRSSDGRPRLPAGGDCR